MLVQGAHSPVQPVRPDLHLHHGQVCVLARGRHALSIPGGHTRTWRWCRC